MKPMENREMSMKIVEHWEGYIK